MSIKSDAIIIRDETASGANTATRVGTNLVAIADDLLAKQLEINANTAKVSYTDAAQVSTNTSDIATIQGEQTTQDDAIALNTAKRSYPLDDETKLSGIATGAEVNPDVVSQVEAEAGTATTERIWTAERVKQAIIALGGSGSVDDTAYGVSWNGVTTVAPSKNALYDFIEAQVFKVDTTSNIIPIFWGGTQAEYDIDFPSGHPTNYFVVITDAVTPPIEGTDISSTAVTAGYVLQADGDGTSSWVAPSGGGLSNIVEDTTPQLGGNLDTNGFNINLDSNKKLNLDIDSDGFSFVTNDVLNSFGFGSSNNVYASALHHYFINGDSGLPNNVNAASFIKSGGTSSQFLKADGSVDSNTYEPLKGTDDNYVTDAEKVVIGNTIGTNTGDDPFTATKISGETLKSTLAGTEEVLINDAGTLKKTTAQDIADLGGGGGASVVQVATYTWTNPTFTGGATGLVDLIPAPSVGKAIIVTGGGITHTSPFTAYTGSSINFDARWNGSPNDVVTSSSIITASGSSKSALIAPFTTATSSLIDNLAFVGELNNIGTDQTLTGALTVWLTYIIVDL